MVSESILWRCVRMSLTWNPVVCLAPRSHRNRRYVPRQRFLQAYARPPSGIRDSATGVYSLSPFLTYCQRDILVWKVA